MRKLQTKKRYLFDRYNRYLFDRCGRYLFERYRWYPIDRYKWYPLTDIISMHKKENRNLVYWLINEKQEYHH